MNEFTESVQCAMDLESFCRARRALVTCKESPGERLHETLTDLCSLYDTSLRSRAFRQFTRKQRIIKVALSIGAC